MKWIMLCVFCTLSLSVQSQIITTFAGNGTSSGVVGDGGPATNATINGANGGTFDKYGNYYVADILGHRIRKVTPAGVITTIAGTGGSGYNGDGIPATAARLDNPTAVVIDSFGNIYIDDLNSYRIRKVNAVTGIISTVAGTGTSGYNGDNIPATNAQLGGVQDICIDKAGNLYLADQVNIRVRKISTSGVITTISGNGGFSATGTGDGGPATAATFNWLTSVAINNAGYLFIADLNGAKIRRVNASGIITTVAGNGVYTYIGDNIPATAAQFNPVRITFDPYDNLVIADKVNDRVLMVDHAGILHSIVGNGIGAYAGDSGVATAASIDYPAGVVFDTCGNLYIAESNNRRVRKVTYNPNPCPYLEVKETTSLNILIYPNPAREELNITSPGISKGEVVLCNMLGQVVLIEQLNSNHSTITIKHLPPGLYLLALTDEEGKRTVHKIVKE